MSVGIFGLFGLVAIAGFVLWVWALANSLSRPDREWEAAGQSRILWVLVIVFTGFIGAILYLLIARPQLDQHSTG